MPLLHSSITATVPAISCFRLKTITPVSSPNKYRCSDSASLRTLRSKMLASLLTRMTIVHGKQCPPARPPLYCLSWWWGVEAGSGCTANIGSQTQTCPTCRPVWHTSLPTYPSQHIEGNYQTNLTICTDCLSWSRRHKIPLHIVAQI